MDSVKCCVLTWLLLPEALYKYATRVAAQLVKCVDVSYLAVEHVNLHKTAYFVSFSHIHNWCLLQNNIV